MEYTAADDYYGILQVTPLACKEVVKAAYKALALLRHPDQNRDDDTDATRQFQLLSEAHEILSDDLRREAYDRDVYPAVRARQGQAWAPQPPPFSGPTQMPTAGSSPRARPQPSPRKPPPPQQQPQYGYQQPSRPRQPSTPRTTTRPDSPRPQEPTFYQESPRKPRPPPRQSSWQESYQNPPHYPEQFYQQYRPPTPEPPEGLFQKLKVYNSDIKKLNNMRRTLSDKMNEAGWAHNTFQNLQLPNFQLFNPPAHVPRDCQLHDATIRWLRRRAGSRDTMERTWMLQQMLKLEAEGAVMVAQYSDFYYAKEAALRECEQMRDIYLRPQNDPPPPPPPPQADTGYFSGYPPDTWL
ncbi:hypothetical protein Sste5346_008284 [Sporothrix stenoceras]|uniref:J domain-containing protein n=1 Tax=Sporothrix stenoceras TaxID=5173 RepID=A0ABR3YQ61_9PEZI